MSPMIYTAGDSSIRSKCIYCRINKYASQLSQGALLGGIVFIGKIYGAMMRPAIPRHSILHGTKSETVKYIDDGFASTAVDLKSQLILETFAKKFH